jgi:two-component system phosphate regulon response regulator PhoB
MVLRGKSPRSGEKGAADDFFRCILLKRADGRRGLASLDSAAGVPIVKPVSREKILIIEDEPDILEVIEFNLKREGYGVFSARDGENWLPLAGKEVPQVVLLDLMLPGLNGLEVCRQLQEDPATRSISIIIVTAKSEETDIVLGLELGADDYIPKPFSPRELVARVEAVLRGGRLKEGVASPERIAVGEVVIDDGRHEVLVHGKPVSFTATEFRLLHFLACRPRRVFTRDQLVSWVIRENAVVTDRNIDAHVRAIRSKLGVKRKLIETVRGVGYRLRDVKE